MSTAARFDEQRRALDTAMEQAGAWPSRSPWVRDAFEALPREWFAPSRLWAWDGREYVLIDRAADPQRWAAEVYAGPYASAVTQVTGGLPTSSLSCPAVVADMADSLLLEPQMRVLELGTGTGWNAALLAWQAGPGLVTSVEADPHLAAGARQRLKDAGAELTVTVGDGAVGWPDKEQYARLMSTYAVERIPQTWITQTLPGGRIVTPWGRLGHVALTVTNDGQCASGWVQGLATFMPARGTPGDRDFKDVRGDQDPDDERPFLRNLAPLQEDWNLRFALRVALPELRIVLAEDDDGLNAWLHDNDESWATLSALGDGKVVAHQGGPRRLADELDEAWDRWVGLGSPELYDFGLTVEADGSQYMWATDADTGPRWPIREHCSY